jgi:hypothetical protein
LFLPSHTNPPHGLRDVAGGGPDPNVDADNCERLWSAYAWPITTGTTGGRAFFINESGLLLQTRMYSSVSSGPNVSPAYSAALSASGMTSPPATWYQGVDTNTWIPVP